MKIWFKEMKHSFKTGEPTVSLMWFIVEIIVGLTILGMIEILVIR